MSDERSIGIGREAQAGLPHVGDLKSPPGDGVDVGTSRVGEVVSTDDEAIQAVPTQPPSKPAPLVPVGNEPDGREHSGTTQASPDHPAHSASGRTCTSAVAEHSGIKPVEAGPAARADRSARDAFALERRRWRDLDAWIEEFEQVKVDDILRIQEVIFKRPAFPDQVTVYQREMVADDVELALDHSGEYGLRFAGRLKEACAALGMSVQGRGELTVDHFVIVAMSITSSRRMVTVNGERLGDPVTVERAVAMISEHRDAVSPSGFDPEAFLRDLYEAYSHVISSRLGHNSAALVTLKDCHRALRKADLPSQPDTPAPRPRGRPPAGAGRVTPAVRKTASAAETRFRSDLSRLLASGSDRVVDGHRLHVLPLRGEGGMMLVEPRSGNMVQYRSIEFRKVSPNVDR